MATRAKKIRTVAQAQAAAEKIVGKRATVQASPCFVDERPRPARMYGPCERRCGHSLYAMDGAHDRRCKGGVMVYSVGRVELGLFNAIRGEGASWEEALARAALREHGFCRACERKEPCAVGDKLRAAVEAATHASGR